MIRIDVLPDDVLLEIFEFYVKNHSLLVIKTDVEAWQTLVHVCRRWRSLVFESPHRLNLQLCCTPSTDALDIWPVLPLVIRGDMTLTSGVDNIVVALGQSNRVCQVNLWKAGRQPLENVLAAMQVPFPKLTKLRLFSLDDETPPVIPDSFLGGSAACLQDLELSGIPFPGLPKLLSSATHLVYLDLSDIPHTGYFSPDAMVALLSALSNLKGLSLKFQSPQSYPNLKSRQLPPLKRSVIPSLTRFFFKGVTEYLEDLVTCIDAPQLDDLRIIFFNHYVASLIEISCREPDWQLSSIVQVCNSSLPPLSMVEDLYIEHQYSQLVWKSDAIENTLWLELLPPFTAVKNLYLAEEFAPGIAAALEELVEGRITEVLPSLQNIFIQELKPQGPFREHIEQFVAARQLSGHPVAISVWNWE